MSTTTKALQLQKREWLRAIQDGTGERAKDILATVIVKATPQQLTVLRAFQAAFVNPIPIRQHMKGQSYLTKLLEEQLVEADAGRIGDADSMFVSQDEEAESDNNTSRAEEGDRDSDSLTAVFKTPEPARRSKKSRKTEYTKSEKTPEKRRKKHKMGKAKAVTSISEEEESDSDDNERLLRADTKNGKEVASLGISRIVAAGYELPENASKAKNILQTPNNKIANQEVHEGGPVAHAPPETPKRTRLSKWKERRARRKAKRSQAEDLADDEDEAQSGSSKRKAEGEEPQTLARSAKKAKNAPLTIKCRTHSATPGPSRLPAHVNVEECPNAKGQAQQNVIIRFKQESDDEVQMFSQPTTPFKQYRPIVVTSARSPPAHLRKKNDRTAFDHSPPGPMRSVQNLERIDRTHVDPAEPRSVMPHKSRNTANTIAPQAQQSNRAAPQVLPARGDEPYRDPQGERQYKCRQCAIWFVYSDNHNGACLPRHPGQALLITSRERNARKWSCCGTVGNGNPTNNGCVSQSHIWNGVEFTPREQPRRGQFGNKS